MSCKHCKKINIKVQSDILTEAKGGSQKSLNDFRDFLAKIALSYTQNFIKRGELRQADVRANELGKNNLFKLKNKDDFINFGNQIIKIYEPAYNKLYKEIYEELEKTIIPTSRKKVQIQRPNLAENKENIKIVIKENKKILNEILMVLGVPAAAEAALSAIGAAAAALGLGYAAKDTQIVNEAAEMLESVADEMSYAAQQAAITMVYAVAFGHTANTVYNSVAIAQGASIPKPQGGVVIPFPPLPQAPAKPEDKAVPDTAPAPPAPPGPPPPEPPKDFNWKEVLKEMGFWLLECAVGFLIPAIVGAGISGAVERKWFAGMSQEIRVLPPNVKEGIRKWWARFKPQWPFLITGEEGNKKIQSNVWGMVKAELCKYVTGFSIGVWFDIKSPTRGWDIGRRVGWWFAFDPQYIAATLLVKISTSGKTEEKRQKALDVVNDAFDGIAEFFWLKPEEGPIDQMQTIIITRINKNEDLKNFFPTVEEWSRTKKIDIVLKAQQYFNAQIQKYNQSNTQAERKAILESQNEDIDKKIKAMDEFIGNENPWWTWAKDLVGLDVRGPFRVGIDAVKNKLQNIKDNNTAIIKKGNFSKQIPYVDWVKADPKLPKSQEMVAKDTPGGFDGSASNLEQLNYTERFNPFFDDFLKAKKEGRRLKVKQKTSTMYRFVYKLYGREFFSVYQKDGTEATSRYNVNEWDITN